MYVYGYHGFRLPAGPYQMIGAQSGKHYAGVADGSTAQEAGVGHQECKRLALIELLISWFVVKPHDYCNRNLVNYILGGG